MDKKKCSRCKQILPLSSFGKNRSKPDGMRCYCKECRREYKNKNCHKWPSRSREKMREYRYNMAQSGNVDEMREKKRIIDTRYRANNREKIRVRSMTLYYYRTPKKCSINGCDLIGERHHISYDSIDDFVWLCKDHHIDEHLKNK